MSWRAETRERVEASDRVRSIAAAAIIRAAREQLGVTLSWKEAESLARRGDTESAVRTVEKGRVSATPRPNPAPERRIPQRPKPRTPEAPAPSSPPSTRTAATPRQTVTAAPKWLGRAHSAVDDLLQTMARAGTEDVRTLARDAARLRQRQQAELQAHISDLSLLAEAVRNLDDVYVRHLAQLARSA